jgi:UDP-3-O-[3-hydroxymyristoyl] glucosamine N-acyltransferase
MPAASSAARQVGEDTHFHARATLHHACEIGARGIVHSGAVIGADGFGFANEAGSRSRRSAA